MPSKSAKQARFMRAVAHGWKPSRVKGPTRAVAKEFVRADERKRKGMARGGPVGALSQLGPSMGTGRIMGKRPNPLVQTAQQMPARYGARRFPRSGVGALSHYPGRTR